MSQTIYVTSQGTGNGTSWADATNLHHAISIAIIGDSIFVKEGVYKPTICSPCTETHREMYFSLPCGISLFGGFEGTEQYLFQRSDEFNQTIISGDIDGDNAIANNAYTLLKSSNCPVVTRLDGFTIRDGNSNFEDSSDVSDKRSGAAIYNNGSGIDNRSELEIYHCSFINNNADRSGGAIYNDGRFEGHAVARFFDCVFEDNFSNHGGVAYSNSREGKSDMYWNNCQFKDNMAVSTGGVLYSFSSYAGNISTSYFSNCLFESNNASSCAGIYGLGSNSGTVVQYIYNCTFVDNQAGVGTCVYTNGSDDGLCDAYVSNCIFYNNSASFDNVFHYSGNATPKIYMWHSLVNNIPNCDDLILGSGEISCDGGNLFMQDPLFVDAVNSNYRLLDNSPCIDTGVDSVLLNMGIDKDLDLVARFDGSAIDMGCYEYGNAVDIPLEITVHPTDVTDCSGEEITLAVTAIGDAPLSFQWYKDAQILSGQGASTLHIESAMQSDIGLYFCEIIDGSNEVVYSESAQILVQQTLTPQIVISSNETTVCPGESVNFIFASENEGDDPIYIWFINDGEEIMEIESSQPVFTIDNIDENTTVYCGLISSEECKPSNIVFSNTINIELIQEESPIVTIVSNENQVCQGEEVVFVCNVFNSDSDDIDYVWRINGELVGVNSTVLMIDDVPINNIVICEATLSGQCFGNTTFVSEALSVEVINSVQPSIVVQTQTQTFCEGTDVLFQSIISGGGGGPQYSWLVNGNPIGVEDEEFVTSNLQDGYLVSCQLVSDLECSLTDTVESTPIEVAVLPVTHPSISLSSNQEQYCHGDDVLITATTTDEGTAPELSWYINDDLQENDNFELSIDEIQSGVVVQAILSTNIPCPSAPIVISDPLGIVVNLNPTVSWSSQDTFCLDQMTAVLTGGLPEGGEYNGNFVEDGIFDIETAGIGTYDIEYRYTDENQCSNAISNQIEVLVCSSNQTINKPLDLLAMPNPTGGVLFIKANKKLYKCEVFQTDGKPIIQKSFNGVFHINLDISIYPNGIYFLKLYGKDNNILSTQKVIVSQ